MASLAVTAALVALACGGGGGGGGGNGGTGPPPCPRQPLPTKTGETFVIEDFDNKVTPNDFGFNYFGGNMGLVESVSGIATRSLAPEPSGSTGHRFRLSYDFSGQAQVGPYAGFFMSLFGLTDTLVSLDGSPPGQTTPFPGYLLDTQDIFRGFGPRPNRSVEKLYLDVVLGSAAPITVKFELKDEAGRQVFARRVVTAASVQPISLALPGDFTKGDIEFNWRQVSLFSIIVERTHVGDDVTNPTQGELLIDNVILVDENGEYPDLDTARSKCEYDQAFLEHVRETSLLYFLDFASSDPRTGGIIQDRSSFADLMTVGGSGFQLTAYCVAAERDYIPRSSAADRVLAILRVMQDHSQGPERVGRIGHQGFLYHFLGPDGLRKQNFNFTDTPVDESKNTVELSAIDTALALCGVIVAGRYFDRADPKEEEIRLRADAIYARVNWRFMLDSSTDQFYLGWKPNESRDDTSGRFGRFLLDDAAGEGQYSSKLVDGVEVPATLDYYTDEGLLVALLAIAAPDPNYRVDPSVFFSMRRDRTEFVKTWPGSLFTYQFASCWLDTEALGPDRDPSGSASSINYFSNSTLAMQSCREYAKANPNSRDSLGEPRWGLSACEGPFDQYFSEAAPPLAIATDGGCIAPSGTATTRPLEVGTLTVYGVGCAVVHLPNEAVAALWECQRIGLLHPRFGFADAFNLNIADALTNCVDPADPEILRSSGSWKNFTGFAIDHGPMLILIDNHLSAQFAPKLFMSHDGIRNALATLFPSQTP